MAELRRFSAFKYSTARMLFGVSNMEMKKHPVLLKQSESAAALAAGNASPFFK